MSNKEDLSKYVAEDVTPTWEAIAPLLLKSFAEKGTTATKEFEELMRMAKIADAYANLVKEEHIAISLSKKEIKIIAFALNDDLMAEALDDEYPELIDDLPGIMADFTKLHRENKD